MAPKPYLAPCLVTFRTEINRRWPGRSKISDGWIGDAAHSARVSQHNPDGRGCVRAIDVDKDGIDPMTVVRAAKRHPATWYVIFNRTIWSRTHGWAARRYTGSNPHTGHVHISILLTRDAETQTRAWLSAAVSKLGDRVLQRNNTGRDVAALQRALHITPDGTFGKATEKAVRDAQKRLGLEVDGKVGPKTLKALGLP